MSAPKLLAVLTILAAHAALAVSFLAAGWPLGSFAAKA